MKTAPQQDAILGCLLGTAVGDALGLPAERLSRQRVAAMQFGLRHRFICGHGMFSDDTEAGCVAAYLGRFDGCIHRDELERVCKRQDKG